MFAPGTLVGGRYRLVRVLGQGGMGEVWEAVQAPLGRRVAVKTVLSDLAKEDSLFARFRREAETTAALGHPNIVQVTDFVPGDPPLIIMELLEGETLKDVIEREGKLDPGRAVFIGQQMLSGLAAAHGAGIVHRDVKPANVFLLSTLAMRDIVKVVDFGLAKLVMEAAPATVQMVTRLGQVLGTVAYMAPEQASGEAVDHRADLYAVGASLFHAIAGVKPYDVVELGKPRARLVDLAPWVDRRLGAAIDRALAPRPEDRWPSAVEMAEAIAPFSGRTSMPPSSGGTSRFSMPTPLMTHPVGPTIGSSPSSPAHPSGSHPTSGTAALAPTALAGPTPSFNPPPPYTPSYNPPPPRPMPAPAARGGIPTGVIALVVAVLALPAIGYLVWMVAIGMRAHGAITGAKTQAERAFLDNQALPSCPAPDHCTERLTDHDVTYSLCTNRTPSSNPWKQGEFLVVRRNGKAQIAFVDEPGHLRGLLDDGSFALEGANVAGRLCR